MLTILQWRFLGYARNDDGAKRYQNSAALFDCYAPHYNPEPRTPNPEPRTPNPEPRTLNPEPRTYSPPKLPTAHTLSLML